jgi:hypothetical protein
MGRRRLRRNKRAGLSNEQDGSATVHSDDFECRQRSSLIIPSALQELHSTLLQQVMLSNALIPQKSARFGGYDRTREWQLACRAVKKDIVSSEVQRDDIPASVKFKILEDDSPVPSSILYINQNQASKDSKYKVRLTSEASCRNSIARLFVAALGYGVHLHPHCDLINRPSSYALLCLPFNSYIRHLLLYHVES